MHNNPPGNKEQLEKIDPDIESGVDNQKDQHSETTKPKKSHKKLVILLIALGVLGTITGLALWYIKPWQNLAGVNAPVIIKDEQKQTESVPYKLEVITENLNVPWSLAFTSNERILVTERPGSIKIVENGKVNSRPLVTFAEVKSEAEEGLMGMALDPNYQQNRQVYACMAYQQGNQLQDKVVRFKDNGSSASDFVTILDNIPAAEFHAGCKLKFGPDEKLYITTGDATQKNIAQDLNSLGGKILRINSDGSIPADNPFGNSAVWSYGHRNPQGICWQPDTDQLFSVEHGPSGNDGPGGGDEVNIINKGANYGWPLVSHENKREGTVAPLLVFTPAVAPGACTFYSGDKLPQFKENMFFAALRGEGLYRIEFSKSDPKQITKFEKMSDINLGRLREVIEGPDGNLYFTTSNRDGRGKPQPGDDKMMVIKPQ